MPQPLSSKESSLFKQVIRNYEGKQYKKGIKAADQILRKNPSHGDTLAMKALIMSCQHKSEEAFALAKIALKNDMKSHVCWHVYGLLYKAEKNFEEASKAYKFALKLEPDSQQILRDLALLQVQTRDYQGYIDSRRQMVLSRPQVRQNWTGLAIAHHLAGNLADAENVLTKYEETLKSPPSKADLEHSEALLYKNQVIAETGDIERALDHLEATCKDSLDKVAYLEMRAEYLLKLKRMDQAEKAYRILLERNAEQRLYYDGLIASLGEQKDPKSLKRVYDEFAEKNPRSDAPRRAPLDFLEGDDFREAADVYLRRMLKKSVPSTFANIKALYRDRAKRDIVQDLAEGYVSPSDSTVQETNGQTPNGDSSKLQAATFYFLAQHYDYFRSRDLTKAKSYIEKAIELFPQNVDYHMTLARIWKHSGDTQKAAETMDHARSLDEKDRHINTKAAKYQLRNNQNDDALKTMSKFTRNETTGGPLGDLHEMQCMWFLTEDGEAYLRQQRLGLALKRFTSIFDIFDVWQEDQFDFHTFSLRKGQIRAYIDMMRWEDYLRSHPFFSRTALSAVTTYVMLSDNPMLAHGSLANGTNGQAGYEGMNSDERKRAIKKAKREQQKIEKAEAAKKEEKKVALANAASDENKKEDTDPQGTKLVKTTEPLKDAMKFLQPLLDFSPLLIEAQTTGFEVFIRREKYLRALQCLVAANKIDPEDPVLHEQIIRFKQALDKSGSSLSPKVSQVIQSEFTLLPPDTSLSKFNDTFLEKHSDSARHVQSAIRARMLLSPDSKSKNEAALLSTLDLPSINIDEAREGQKLLKEWKSDKLAEYQSKAAKVWPDSSAFKAPSS